MQLPLEITFHGLDRSPAIEARIREKAGKLERFFSRITSCRVVVEAPHQHSNKGRLYSVRIDVTVPGDEIVVNRTGSKNHAHEDIKVAVRDAFNALSRRLEDHARKVRGEVKSHEAPPHGRVARLFTNDGYGFILTSEGHEVYFHRNSVTDGGFGKLAVGSEVRLALAHGESAEGPQASTVTPIGKHHIVER